MNLLYSIIIAFSMYSALPMPRMDWTEERMRRLFCAFPLVGAVEGLLLVLLDRVFTTAGGTAAAGPEGRLLQVLPGFCSGPSFIWHFPFSIPAVSTWTDIWM